MAVVFEPGDIVYLKSESRTEMTVREISKGEVICEWLDRDGKLNSHSFKSTSLNEYRPRHLFRDEEENE